MRQKTAEKLLKKVEADYNSISQEFSQTRQKPWPEFKFFEPYLDSKHLSDNPTILDLGCGNGRLLTFLKDHLEKKSINYTGLDISDGLLKQAQKQWPQETFLRGSQLSIPLKDKSIDQIWSIAAFHHIPSPKLRLQSLTEMHRVLKKNGTLIMTNWNLFQAKYRPHLLKAAWRSITSFFDYEATDLMIPWGDSGVNRYYHAFRPNELTSLLQDANFEILESFCTKKDQKVSFWQSFNICTICRKK